ncbi:pollen-specific leucine-rich repeat extensin-like protein 1 isoform X2 [Astatotilapia calliptera]|uniref:pollen-specific leucine-rich repeat extensin-like protein 1 isoform X2 n=1 Tax=Astatotilapia calliptera TaxID=8154 RepID=UPI000E428C8F|nr:pollen-specific leucine-rich repeat extensin-like protein 1 isoform X2 [Astatotilapia calliptera]
MASGPCVRVLLLSLLAFSKHAEALTYRRSYSSVIKPYFGKPEDFPHNQYLVSRHKSYAQPRSSLGVYGPENGSPESSYPTAAGLPGGAGASSGRPLNGYLQQESMSSYRSGSSQPHKPSYYQGDTDGALQSKDAMWGLAPSQKRNWIDTGIVSSYPIEMRSVPQRPSNEHQTQPHDKQEQFSDESSMFQSRPQPRPLPQQPRYEASKPQARPRPTPQQPRYEASKPQAQPWPFPQQPRYEASKPQAQPWPFPQQPRYEASKPQAQPWPFPQQPRYEASKLHVQVQPEREQLGDESSKFQPRPTPQQPRYEASKPQAQPRPTPQQPRYEASKPQAQPRPTPQQPRYEASKPQAQPRPTPQQPRYEASKPQAQPRPTPQQPRYEASKPQAQPRPFPQQPHYEVSKLQGSEANSPSGGVLQTKSGMWDLADPRSFRPIPVSLRNLYRWPQQQAPIYNRC